MPRYAHFYTATEAEATASLSHLCPPKANAPHFTNDDAEQLDGFLNGTLTGSSRPRNDKNQPLFQAKQFVDALLSNTSGFSITRETIHRDKFVYHDSTSEESTGEWKTRSRTPSSDEPSPRKVHIATPASGVKATASSDGEYDDLPPELGLCSRNDQLYSSGLFPNHYARYSDDVLQDMDTQFSKWSYDLSEGTTGIPFVMAQAPSDTHESLVKLDREFWMTGDESESAETWTTSHSTAKAVLERAQKKHPKLLNSFKSTSTPMLKTPTTNNAASKDDYASKRAALIAKSKAARDSSLVVSKSANQRRSAMQRNKNRRSIMPSPPPKSRRPEPVRKQDTQTEESEPTVIILDNKDDDQRRELDSALQYGTLDFGNDRHMKLLMNRLTSIEGDNAEAKDRETGKAEENGYTVKTQRLKGKARKKTRSGAAR